MAVKRPCSLFCSPQPIARLVQVFPKLAIVFFLIHITVIIYSFYNPKPSPHAKDVPPGVVDDKMKLVENDYRMHMNKNASDNILPPRIGAVSRNNKTKSLLLQKLKPDGNHDYKGKKDSNIQVNLQKRSLER